MRFVSFAVDGQASWGVIDGDNVRSLAHLYPSLADAIVDGALAECGKAGAGGTVVALDRISFLPVVARPGKIFCIGLNYENHRRETARPEVANPTVFLRFGDSQTAHKQPILMPRESDKLDYEGELALVIGKPGRRIAAADALTHVAGYSCYNDGSVRDWQAHTMQFTPGKNFPETGAFGPWLVTPDEFGPLGPQRIQTRLNGTVMQDAVLSDMIFSIPRLIEYCSTFTPLAAGDVIVTGTPGGVGAKRNPPLFMKPGDRVEVEIDGIGILENDIRSEASS